MRMEPTGEVFPLPKLVEPIDNLNGIFLKQVYFLNDNFSKTVIVGIFKNRDYNLGVMIKGRHEHFYWSFDTFNQFSVNFDNISKALRDNKRFHLEIYDDEETIKVDVMESFGAPYVFIGNHDYRLVLSSGEWDQFVSNLPLINLDLCGLFYEQDLIKQFIFGGTNTVSSRYYNRLVCEIARQNGCSS